MGGCKCFRTDGYETSATHESARFANGDGVCAKCLLSGAGIIVTVPWRTHHDQHRPTLALTMTAVIVMPNILMKDPDGSGIVHWALYMQEVRGSSMRVSRFM